MTAALRPAATIAARVRAELAFPLAPCPECEGAGSARVACCTAVDVGCDDDCRCGRSRRGWRDVTCSECHGEGAVPICGRCQSYRVSSDDDGDGLVCCACGLGEEGE